MKAKTILQLENGFLFLLTLTLFIYFHFPIFFFFIFLLLPDISMIGYLANPSFGAKLYNSAHNLVFPIILIFIYMVTDITLLLPTAIVWCAHIFMDRTFGYGLKYPDKFKHTHIQNL